MHTSDTPTLYKEYVATMQKCADVEYATALLSWDKEVNMPPMGSDFRTQQMATLAGIAHNIFCAPAFGELLETLAVRTDLEDAQARNIQLTRRDYARRTCLDEAFVMRKARTCSDSYNTWLKARAANDFSLFRDALAEVVAIKREEAELMGYKGHPYDALLEEFEPNYTSEMLDTLFTDVKAKLVDFVRKIREQEQVSDEFFKQHYPKDEQWNVSLDILKKMGYNFDAGRQDWSPHPFTINFSPQDVRVTTRVDEQHLASLLWSSIHEGGHALYEQGLPAESYGLPLGQYVSLGIHESQARLWENNVGRSLAFWKTHFGVLQEQFSEQLGGTSVEHFYKGMNKIEANFIRTEADELHYHFHILIRYEIEKALMEGSIEVKDLEEVWNAKYKAYLDVDVPSANQGVLQDVHWAYGNIGYFPTYSLGSFYAAQFFHKATQDIPDLVSKMEAGDTSPLLGWLEEQVYRHGRYYSAKELCEKITGEPLNFDYFYKYAVEKYSAIYS